MTKEESYKEFKKEPNINGKTWIIDCENCIANTTVFASEGVFITVSIHLEKRLNKFLMGVSNPFSSHVYLDATTAKEAAHEALQLVKQEAQKLVNALSEQNDFWTKIDTENLPKIEVFAINENGEALGGLITKSFNPFCLYCESENDKIKSPTHFCTYEQILKFLPKP